MGDVGQRQRMKDPAHYNHDDQGIQPKRQVKTWEKKQREGGRMRRLGEGGVGHIFKHVKSFFVLCTCFVEGI